MKFLFLLLLVAGACAIEFDHNECIPKTDHEQPKRRATEKFGPMTMEWLKTFAHCDHVKEDDDIQEVYDCTQKGRVPGYEPLRWKFDTDIIGILEKLRRADSGTIVLDRTKINDPRCVGTGAHTTMTERGQEGKKGSEIYTCSEGIGIAGISERISAALKTFKDAEAAVDAAINNYHHYPNGQYDYWQMQPSNEKTEDEQSLREMLAMDVLGDEVDRGYEEPAEFPVIYHPRTFDYPRPDCGDGVSFEDCVLQKHKETNAKYDNPCSYLIIESWAQYLPGVGACISWMIDQIDITDNVHRWVVGRFPADYDLECHKYLGRAACDNIAEVNVMRRKQNKPLLRVNPAIDINEEFFPFILDPSTVKDYCMEQLFLNHTHWNANCLNAFKRHLNRKNDKVHAVNMVKNLWVTSQQRLADLVQKIPKLL